jgi:O-antigen/teichoic acid export membrane protein
MTLVKQAFKGAMWLGFFRAISQTISWIATIIVARILVPQDYGLMEMATILTGYVALFSELGLGDAIVQREEIKDEELSSLFWFLICWGFILALVCIVLSYLTVVIFHEGRILRLTQSVSLLYIIGAFLIVPLNKLNRELRYRAIGASDAFSVLISCLVMVLVAKYGGGVWTFIIGHITREFTRAILVFIVVRWRPKLHFDLKEIKPYLKFGLNLAGANSLHYINTKSDRFFGGRSLGANALGYYSLSLQLAAMPTEKLISLINYVSFPVFSRYQNMRNEFNRFYLNLVQMIAFITFPIYVGGILIADNLIPLLLGPKWIPLIFPFKLLCIAQLIISITTQTSSANNAQGRPQWSLYMGIIGVLLLPGSFYIASMYGLNALVIPWITVYPALRLGFTWVTLKKLDIFPSEYLKSLKHPVIATSSMIAAILIIQQVFRNSYPSLSLDLTHHLIVTITVGVISYSSYVLIFQRSLLKTILSLRKA